MSRRAGLDAQNVIAAAARLADDSGLEYLSLATLAEKLGIRKPSLYNHISSLGGLHHDLALLGLSELTERLERAAMGKSGDSAVFALALAYRAYVKERPGVYSATVPSPRLASIPDPDLQRVERQLLDVILAVLSAYQLSEENVIHTARALRSVVHGFATIENNRGFGIALDIDASFDYMITVFIAGLHAQMQTD